MTIQIHFINANSAEDTEKLAEHLMAAAVIRKLRETIRV